MPKFTDRTGRVWIVELDVATLNRIRAKLEVDLYSALDDEFSGLRSLLEDLPKLVDVLYLACEREAKEKNVSDEDFGRSLAGDALEDAGHALVDALIDFFPHRKARDALQRAVRISRQRQNQTLDRVLDGLDAIGNGNAGNSPESSASIPAATSSAN